MEGGDAAVEELTLGELIDGPIVGEILCSKGLGDLEGFGVDDEVDKGISISFSSIFSANRRVGLDRCRKKKLIKENQKLFAAILF